MQAARASRSTSPPATPNVLIVLVERAWAFGDAPDAFGGPVLMTYTRPAARHQQRPPLQPIHDTPPRSPRHAHRAALTAAPNLNNMGCITEIATLPG